MKRLLCALSLAVLAVAFPAGAQQPAAADDLEAYTVEELVVQAHLPGPAWWRVSDADTVVYVLGIPDALPRGLAWDQTILKRRLAGANRLITPPVIRASANPLAVPKLLADYNTASHSRLVLQDSLGAALRDRFLRAVARAGKTPRDYNSLRPWFAGVRLTGDYRKHAGLDYGQPLAAVTRAGKRARVKAAPATAEDMRAAQFLSTLRAIPDSVGTECLAQAVEEIEAGDAVVRRAAQAWAVGDVAGALAAPRSSERCWASVPGAAKLKREALAGQADAIEAALRQPGHAVAVLPLRSLVAREGVLQRLRDRGYEVRAPQ